MSFLDKAEKNVDRLMKEVTGGSVAGFVGTAGMSIDALFAGPFHPDSGHGSKNKKLLAKQLKDRREKRKDLESNRDDVIDDYTGIPDPVGGYYETETELIALAYDELFDTNEFNKQYNDEMTPPQDTKWVEVDINYHYDDTYISRSEKNTKHFDVKIKYDKNITKKSFVKKSDNNWEFLETKLKYDKNEPYIEEEDFINDSATNWKYIKEKV